MTLNSFEDALGHLSSKKKSIPNPEMPDFSKLTEDAFHYGESLLGQAKENRWKLMGLALGAGILVGYSLTSRKKS